MGFPLVRLKESDLFIPRRRGSGSRPRRGDSTDDEISDSDGSRRASASSSPARGDGVDYSTSPVGGRGSAQRQSLVVSRNWQVPPQMPSLLQQPLQPNEQGTMPSLSNVQPIETTSESLNAQLQDLLRDMPELVKPVLLQVQTEILQLDGAQRQALLGALPAFAKTATSLKMEIADHNSLLLKFIEKWKDYYGEPSQVAYALHNGIQLLVDEYTVPEGSINVYVYGDLPDHLRATRALAFFKSTLAAAGATLVMRPGAPIRVLVDISGNPCTRPNGAKGRQSLPVSRLKIGFQPIPNRNDTILASHGFVPEIQLGPQVLPKCKFVNMLDAIYASVGMPASGNFTSGKEGRIKCPIPVAFSMGQILDLLFDRKTYHIASRTLADSKNKRDDPTQQLQCYQIIAKAHYDYLKNLWPDLDKFLDGKQCDKPSKRVFTKKWWDDHPDEEVKRNVRVK